MSAHQAVDAPKAVLEKCGPPERVFRPQRKLWVTLLSVMSVIVAIGMIGFVSLLLLVFHTSESTEMPKTPVAIASIYIFCGLVTAPALFMLYCRHRVSRKRREGFAIYADMLVHFRSRHLRKIPFAEIAEVATPESGRDAAVVRLRNGDSVSIPGRLPGAADLSTLISRSITQRTLQDVVDTLKAKHPADFGLVAVDVTGITCRGTRVEWDAVERIDVEPGQRMTVYQRQANGISKPAFSVAESNIQDRALLLELLGNLSPNLVQTVKRQAPQPPKIQSLTARMETGSRQPADTTDSAAEAQEQLARYQTLMFGALLLLSCFYLNHVFGRLESGEAESVRLWWGFALLYNTVGPTLTVAICGIMGVILSVMGVNTAFFQSHPESPVRTA